MLLRKEIIVLSVFITGLLLIIFSWYKSYPIGVDSPFDFLPNHISPFFWIGVSVVCAALYIMAMLSKKNSLKLIATIGIILFLFSSAYFFWYMPGVDSQYFRGLTEYFNETGDLNFQSSYHSYYQWPIFFVFSKIAFTLGLNPRFFEFILFGLFSFIYGVSLYSVFQKSSKDGAFLAVVSYFIIIWWYLDYQFVPFTLGFGFLLILFMLDSFENKKTATTLTILIIFAGITLIHSFVPLFFVSYVFIKYILGRERKYLNFFLITLLIYFIVLMFRAEIFFKMGIEDVLGLSSYTSVSFIGNVIVSASTPLDEFAQMISRAVFIVTALVAGSGFVILLLKRKLGKTNITFLLSGMIFFLIGFVALPILGTRALQILVIPLSLGVVYLQETKFKRYFQVLFLILLILFICTPLHSSFNSTAKQITYQTEANHQCADFLLHYYRPNEISLMGTDVRTGWYIAPKLSIANVTLGNSLYSFFVYDPDNYSCILYTVGLEKAFINQNYTAASAFQEMNEYSVFYSSGSSQILVSSG